MKLWIDKDQGIGGDDVPFGFVGTNEIDDYCGWFFDVVDDDDVEAIVDSMAPDSTCEDSPEIDQDDTIAMIRKAFS